MSHGSEQSEDYWPGYVDALTSMVQVLAFVMMLLAMAVFVLSQSVSKGAVEAIAKAANIDVPADANVAQLTTKVLEYIREHQGAPSQGAAAAVSAAAQDSKTTPSGPAADAEAQSAPTAAADASAASPKEQRVIATQNSTRQKPWEPTPDSKRATVNFASRSFKVDAGISADVTTFLTGTNAVGSKKQLVIRAYASSTDGALSEARRLAYYRALTVRRELTDHKIRAEDIRINVVDTTDKERSSSVDIFISDGP